MRLTNLPALSRPVASHDTFALRLVEFWRPKPKLANAALEADFHLQIT